MTQKTEAKPADESFFLPNFCETQSVFLVILTGEILALLLTLANGSGKGDLWSNLGLISLIIQWVALSSAGVLCLLRNRLAKCPVVAATLISYTTIVLITLLYTFIALMVFYQAKPGFLSEYHQQVLLENGLIGAIVGAVTLRYFHLQQQYRMRLSMESEARIQALQSRIHPHFLFNSMNIIATLTRTNPELAEQVVEDLSDLFRASLDKAGKLVRLAEEIHLCERYGNIEKLRLGERLDINWRIECNTEKVNIPLLTIQPLLENAIYHGVEPLTRGGTINIVIEQQNKLVMITIANPFPANRSGSESRGNKIALKNIQERLLVLFGETAKLKTQFSDEMYIVSMQIPSGV